VLVRDYFSFSLYYEDMQLSCVFEKKKRADDSDASYSSLIIAN
jgi:hypothetical protein